MEELRERVDILERVLKDWLDADDTPDDWMRCRNNAKLAIGRDADPDEYVWDNINDNKLI